MEHAPGRFPVLQLSFHPPTQTNKTIKYPNSPHPRKTKLPHPLFIKKIRPARLTPPYIFIRTYFSFQPPGGPFFLATLCKPLCASLSLSRQIYLSIRLRLSIRLYIASQPHIRISSRIHVRTRIHIYLPPSPQPPPIKKYTKLCPPLYPYIAADLFIYKKIYAYIPIYLPSRICI